MNNQRESDIKKFYELPKELRLWLGETSSPFEVGGHPTELVALADTLKKRVNDAYKNKLITNIVRRKALQLCENIHTELYVAEQRVFQLVGYVSSKITERKQLEVEKAGKKRNSKKG